MAGGAVIHKLAPLRCVAAGPLRSLMNNCETDIGAAQDLPEWAVFSVDSGRPFRAQSQGGEEFLGLRSSPGWCPVPAGHYNAIAPSALKRTYLLRNRRAESTRGNNPNAP